MFSFLLFTVCGNANMTGYPFDLPIGSDAEPIDPFMTVKDSITGKWSEVTLEIFNTDDLLFAIIPLLGDEPISENDIEVYVIYQVDGQEEDLQVV